MVCVFVYLCVCERERCVSVCGVYVSVCIWYVYEVGCVYGLCVHVVYLHMSYL